MNKKLNGSMMQVSGIPAAKSAADVIAGEKAMMNVEQRRIKGKVIDMKRRIRDCKTTLRKRLNRLQLKELLIEQERIRQKYYGKIRGRKRSIK